MGWQGWFTAILRLVTAILNAVRLERSSSMRRRAASDGAGVLLGQLNPGSSDAAGPAKPANTGAERDAGRVDGQ